MPLVSVVTVVYNAVNEIEPTILSVLPFRNDEVEYVVIDGGSTDGTVDVIRKYASQIDFFVTEPDKGIYDALNKATTAARGHYVTTINVGDRLLAVPLKSIRQAFEANAEIAMFGVEIAKGKVHRSFVSPMLKYANTIHHQGAYYRRTPDFKYDTSYRVYADFDLNQRYYKAGKKFMAFDETVCTHDNQGISINRKSYPEYYRVAGRNFGSFYSMLAKVYHEYTIVRRKVGQLIRNR